MITEKIIEFRDGIDEFLKQERVTFKDYVETSLGISSSGCYNLAILKYYVEKEESSERDIALKFINLLQDCYDGRNIDIGTIKELQDLYVGKENKNVDRNMRDMLLTGSGIVIGIINEAWIEDNNLVQVTSGVVQNKNGSFAGKVTTYSDLINYKNILFSKYSYAMSSWRIKDIESKISLVEDAEFGDNTIICFASMMQGTAKYTIFNDTYEAKYEDGEVFNRMFDYKYKGAVYDVWVL